jgi:putative intracellular protease/amidase
MKTVALYATDTMADWEYGYVVAGLSKADGFRLVVASDGPTDEVRTMGGLRIRPDTTLEDVRNADALILPGAQTWDHGHDAALSLAASVLDDGVPVAAICGATLGLARAGILNDRRHTSNAAEFLTQATEYAGADHYVEARTVKDGALITAPATAPVDFAKAVFEALDVFPQHITDAWYGLYTTGDRKYYDQLASA